MKSLALLVLSILVIGCCGEGRIYSGVAKKVDFTAGGFMEPDKVFVMFEGGSSMRFKISGDGYVPIFKIGERNNISINSSGFITSITYGMPE